MCLHGGCLASSSVLVVFNVLHITFPDSPDLISELLPGLRRRKRTRVGSGSDKVQEADPRARALFGVNEGNRKGYKRKTHRIWRGGAAPSSNPTSFLFVPLSITLIHTPQKIFLTKRCGTLSEPDPGLTHSELGCAPIWAFQELTAVGPASGAGSWGP